MQQDGVIDRVIDRLVAVRSPRKAFMRKHFRRMERDDDYRESFLTLMRARGYRAAKSPSGATGFNGGSSSADTELSNDLSALRNRSRELNRDDPIGCGLTETFVRNVVGTGLRPRARTTSQTKNDNMEAIWLERSVDLTPADRLACGEVQQLWFRQHLEGGETIIKQAKRTDGEPLWFETIEGDRLATPGNKSVEKKGENEVRDGVEKNADGVPVKYWISKRHPGDTLSLKNDWSDFNGYDPSVILHWKLTRRPGQTRGLPLFHSILQDIRDLDLLLLAGLKRTQIAACLAAFIKSDADIEDMFGDAANQTAQKYGYRLDQNIEPGMLFKLFPNESIETLIPNFPTPELGGFIIMICRRIGAALGVSWQVVLKDFSGSTYSSARADLLETRQVYKLFRNSFATRVMTWVWRSIMIDAQLRGDSRASGLTRSDIDAVQWYGDGWELIDRLKEFQANAIALKTCQLTLEDVWLEAGKDPDQMKKAITDQASWLASIGANFDFTPVPIPEESQSPARLLAA